MTEARTPSLEELHLIWLEAGCDPARFWELTPYEASREMQAAHSIRNRHQQELIWMAWHIEAFARTNKLPPLKEVMTTAKRSRSPQDPEIVLANIKLAFGYPGETKT